MNKQYRLLVALTFFIGVLCSLGQGFSGPLSLVSGSAEPEIEKLLLGLLFFFITLLAAKVIKVEFIHGYVERVLKVSVPALIGDIFSAIVIFIGSCLILALVFKQNISALLVTGAGSAAILGFALKDFAVALAVGISLNFEDTYKVGDRIKVQTGGITQEGVVQKITWRNTVILTDLMETVFIPNVNILVSAITNFDLPDTSSHRKLTLEIDYGVSVDSVERILYAGTLNAMGVKFSSPPRVVALELKESGVLYEIRYSITDIRDRVAAHHAVIKSVLESMRVANITVSRCLDFDQDVRIANRAQDVYHLVQQVRLFSNFPQDALNDLAAGLVARRIGATSRIVHAGDTTPAIFIVAEGIISRPRLGRDEHILKQRFIATEFFGEDALISGLPHQSTVVAETNVLLYQLNREVLQHLLLKYPLLDKQLAANLATIYASHNSDLIADKSDSFEYQKSLYEGMISANFIS
jgi:small-conductance mechanosensitive channel/CRP-like cAMP-binding protein